MRPADRAPVRVSGRRTSVSTQAARTDPLRRLEPLRFVADPTDVRAAVLAVLARSSRLRVLERDDASVHAVERSAWLRIPTDIEIRIDGPAGLLHLTMTVPLVLGQRSHPRVRGTQLLARIGVELRGGGAVTRYGGSG